MQSLLTVRRRIIYGTIRREKGRKSISKSHLAGRTTSVIGTVTPSRGPPKRVRNAEVRAREYLTNAEVDGSSKPPGSIATAIATPPTGSRRAGDLTLGRHRLRPWANPRDCADRAPMKRSWRRPAGEYRRSARVLCAISQSAIPPFATAISCFGVAAFPRACL